MSILYESKQGRALLLYTNKNCILLRRKMNELFSRPVYLANDYLDSISEAYYGNTIYYAYRNQKQQIIVKNTLSSKIVYQTGSKTTNSIYQAGNKTVDSICHSPKLLCFAGRLLLFYITESTESHTFSLCATFPLETGKNTSQAAHKTTASVPQFSEANSPVTHETAASATQSSEATSPVAHETTASATQFSETNSPMPHETAATAPQSSETNSLTAHEAATDPPLLLPSGTQALTERPELTLCTSGKTLFLFLFLQTSHSCYVINEQLELSELIAENEISVSSVNSQELTRLQDALQAQENSIANLSHELQAKGDIIAMQSREMAAITLFNNKLSAQNTELQKKDSLLADQVEELRKAKTLLVSQEEELSQKTSLITEQAEEITQKDKLISGLSEESIKKDELISELSEEAAKKDGQIIQQADEIAKKDTLITKQEAALADRDTEICQLNAIIKSAANQYNDLMKVAEEYRNEALKWRAKFYKKRSDNE